MQRKAATEAAKLEVEGGGVGALDGAGDGLPVVRERGGTVDVVMSVAAAAGGVRQHCRPQAQLS